MVYIISLGPKIILFIINVSRELKKKTHQGIDVTIDQSLEMSCCDVILHVKYTGTGEGYVAEGERWLNDERRNMETNLVRLLF